MAGWEVALGGLSPDLWALAQGSDGAAPGAWSEGDSAGGESTSSGVRVPSRNTPEDTSKSLRRGKHRANASRSQSAHFGFGDSAD